MTNFGDFEEHKRYLDGLYAAYEGLKRLVPSRNFSFDGHLVGSGGYVVAAYIFDLDRNAAATTAHDANTRDGRAVDIKQTQRKRVANRNEPGHIMVMHRPRH